MKELAITFSLSLLFAFSCFAGGFIVVVPGTHESPVAVRPSNPDIPNPSLFPLEVRSNKIRTQINTQIAVTQVEQIFYNPTSRQLEGYFLFPVPEGSTIREFTMLVNGVETSAELLDAKKAREIYEEIVRKAKDPALLEYSNKKLFKVRIFPILPRSEQKISLSYVETLEKENGLIEYSFPMNTEKYAAKPLNQVSFHIDVESDMALKTLFCPTHQVEIIRHGAHKAVVGFEASNVRSDRDFKFYFNLDQGKFGLSSLNFKEPGEEGYFFLSLSPGSSEKTVIIPKDITFVLDASGSMSGDKIDQAKKALLFCIENLNPDDRFNLIRFSTEATALFESLQKAGENERYKAKKYIEELRASGGTNIEEALQIALSDNNNKDNRPSYIIFLTDGKPTIGETDEAALLNAFNKQSKGLTKVFTFGVGTDLNTHLLDKLTEITKAYRTYVLPGEDLEIKLSSFYEKVSSPVMSDVKLVFDKSISISSVFPRDLPDLFKGQTVTVMGRYSGFGPGVVSLEGNVNGRKEKYDYVVPFVQKNTENDFIPPLWAARCVGYLLDQIRLHGESPELVTEVVRLAKKHGIVTPYTSYLIIEDERQLVSRQTIRQEDQLLRSRTENAPAPLVESLEEEYHIMDSKDGNAGVKASSDVQALNKAENVAEAKKTDSRLDYKDKAGNNMNLSSGIQNIKGRAFYQNNSTWIDSRVQDVSKGQVNRIRFNSPDYFQLIKDHPESVAYLSLGQNVRFVLGGEIMEIFE